MFFTVISLKYAFCWQASDHTDGQYTGQPHALADGNQHIQIREKTLEFSTTVSSTLSLYLTQRDLTAVIIKISY